MPSWTYCWSNGTSIRMEIRGKDWAPCVPHIEVAQSRRKWPRSMWLPISDPQGPSLTFSDINDPVGPVYFDSRITPYRLFLLCFTAGCVETKWFKFESWPPVYGSTLPTSTASQWLVEYRKMLCDGYNYNVASPRSSVVGISNLQLMRWKRPDAQCFVSSDYEIWSCYLSIWYEAFSFLLHILHCHEVRCLLPISHKVGRLCVSFCLVLLASWQCLCLCFCLSGE